MSVSPPMEHDITSLPNPEAPGLSSQNRIYRTLPGEVWVSWLLKANVWSSNVKEDSGEIS